MGSRKKQKQLNKQIKKNNDRVQDFFEIDRILEDSLLTTTRQQIYYIKVTPTNLSVLSEITKHNLINSLCNVISQMPKSELICINSSQSYEHNKRYMAELAERESNAGIKALDEMDIQYIDKLRSSMATSRVFYFVIRCHANDSDTEKGRFVSSCLQRLQDNKFDACLAHKEEIKKLLSIYLEQNVYSTPPDYDGEQYGLDKEYYDLKGFVDVISPSVMDFTHINRYIIGNTYRTAWAIRSYATSTKQQALLRQLGETDGVTLHIYNRLVSPAEKNKIFEVAERRNRSKIYNSHKVTDKAEGEENLSELQRLIKKSHKTKEQYIYCAVYIEMSANSPERLKEIKNDVSQALTDNHLIKDELLLRQRDGFVCAAPFGFNILDKQFERVLPASSVANLYPFSYSGKTDENGLIIGRAVNGSNILVDFDKRAPDKTNGHIAIFGNSGEGKSWLIKLLICIFRQQQKYLYSIDVESEFIDITNRLGGSNVDMMSGKYFINLLEFRFLKSEEDADVPNSEVDAVNKETLLAQHIAFLRDFFKVYKPELTSSQLDILEIMLAETYKLFHITPNTDFKKFKTEDYPILSDLYKTVERELNQYDDKAHSGREMLYSKDDCRKLLLALQSICVGTDSMFFNGYTNLPNADHINFIVQDMLNTNENLKNAMYFNIFSFMQHKYFSQGNTVVINDETREVIKSWIVVMYLRSSVKRGRKRNSDIIVSSQNIEDIMLPDTVEYTKPLFSIPTHRFLFYPGTIDSSPFKKITNIADSEYELISSSKQGYCLYCCGDERYHLQIIAPPHKSALFGTAGGR